MLLFSFCLYCCLRKSSEVQESIQYGMPKTAVGGMKYLCMEGKGKWFIFSTKPLSPPSSPTPDTISPQHQAPAALPSVTSETQRQALFPQTLPRTPHAADSLPLSERALGLPLKRVRIMFLQIGNL